MPNHIKRITRRQALSKFAESPSDAPDLPALLRRIFENRQIRTRSELDYSLAHLHPPSQLKGIDLATTILQQAMLAEQKILVIGDYDADGATATAVALLGLRGLRAKHVDYLVPNRFEYGYGLSPEIAEVALRLQPQVVITVDNGISSLSGIALLRAAGVIVVVTDHHLAGAELPNANAIVNPNQPGCQFPSKALSGVGVMFYLLLSLRASLRQANWFDSLHFPEPNLAELLDLVALGTVADLVPLDYNNRILVAQGVARVRAGHARPGIKALLEIAGRQPHNLVAADFGFVIGPRLNAAGRLRDIACGIECLLTQNATEALEYARLLDEINRQRRQIEQSMQQRAIQIVTRLEQEQHAAASPDSANQFGFCLFDRDWHHGIVGLVASRVKERFSQPVVAFACDSAAPGKLRGSARSVEGLHIRDLLESLASSQVGLIEKFGGHAMAAGLTIDEQQLQTFTQGFRERVTAHYAVLPPTNEILTDGELTAEQMTAETAELLQTASPWGQRFAAPLFDGEFRVLSQKIIAQQHLKMVLQSVAGAPTLQAIMFRYVEPGQKPPPLQLQRIKIAYQLQINHYYNNSSLQLVVEYMQPLAD